MQLESREELAPAIGEIVNKGGVAVVVGPADSGKTTFCAAVVNAAIESGKSVCVVDADLDHSQIGPPACIGLAYPHERIESIGVIPAFRTTFVGAVFPQVAALEHAVAVRSTVDCAAELSPHIIIVDMGSAAHGPGARRLIQSELALLAPRSIAALQRDGECEPLLESFRFRSDISIHRLSASEAAVRKSLSFRSQRRASQLANYFAGSEIRRCEFDKVVFGGTWLNGGAPIEPHLQRFIAASLKVRVFHAELRNKHLGIVSNAAPAGESGLALVQEQLRPLSITVTPAPRLKNLLVGLSDGGGKLLGMGLISALDFRRREVGLLTPVRSHAAVRHIQFGYLRVEESGKELGVNQPGEV